jgi:hypothetical protein
LGDVEDLVGGGNGCWQVVRIAVEQGTAAASKSTIFWMALSARSLKNVKQKRLQQ